jgi:hypothetical protein
MAKIASMRLTASSAIGETGAALRPCLALFHDHRMGRRKIGGQRQQKG